MISMDPPRHDRIKALFQRGFTPKRIAEHEERIRGIVNRVLDRVAERGECDLVLEVAGPVVSRVIGSFIGTPEEDDRRHIEETNMVLGFGDEDLRPTEEAVIEMISRNWEETMEMVAERRENPGMDDLMDVLVHSKVDGEGLSDAEIFMGLGLLGAAGNDSTRSVFTSGMLGLFENPDQKRLLLDDPTLIDGAVEELLRMYPAFAHFRRTATRDVEMHGRTIREGDKVLLWYVSSNRDEERLRGPPAARRHRTPDHQAFGAGGRHFCLGAALARLEIRMLLAETLRRFPEIELAGEPTKARSLFLNQLKTLPVRFTPEPAKPAASPSLATRRRSTPPFPPLQRAAPAREKPVDGAAPTIGSAGAGGFGVEENGRVCGPPSPPWNEISSSNAQPSSSSGS